MYIVYDPDKNNILDGGYEARKGRIWLSEPEMYARYKKYVNMANSVIAGLEASRGNGMVSDITRYKNSLLARIEFLDSMVVYTCRDSDVQKSGVITFVEIGVMRDLAEAYFERHSNKR